MAEAEMTTDWPDALERQNPWRDPKQELPPEEVWVEIRWSGVYGTITCQAKRLAYKPGSTKAQMKKGWRWITATGYVYMKEHIEAWRSL